MDTILFAGTKRPFYSKRASHRCSDNEKLKLDEQSLSKLPAQEFPWCFITEERSLSHVLFHHLAHRGDRGILFQKFYHFNSVQEKWKVSASTRTLPGLW